MTAVQLNGRVLICDDEEGIRDILARLVRQAGYEAVEAANGPAALAAIRELPPDVLFLDIRMPGLDGIEVLRQARLLIPCLAVLMISTSAAGADVARALDGGACGYLIKPFRHEDVLHSLASVMASRRQPAVRELRSP